MLLGEALVGLLRQRQLLVVALQQREPEVPGGRRLEAGEVGHRRATTTPAMPIPASTAARAGVGAQREREVEDQPVDGDDHERDEQGAAEAREGPRGRDVVQGDTEVGPREPAERRSARRNASSTHPHRGGEQRRRDAATRERGDQRTRSRRRCAASTTSSGTIATYAEVADPREHHGVRGDAEGEPVERGVATDARRATSTAAAPARPARAARGRTAGSTAR